MVFHQYLSLMPSDSLACLLRNQGFTKLTDDSLVKTFVLATLFRWNSLREIEQGIRSQIEIQNELDIETISASQLSRRLQILNTSDLAHILTEIAIQYRSLQSGAKGVNPKVGPLKLVDSTHIGLTKHALNWNGFTKDNYGVKLHLGLLVASPGSVFPDKMIPSTGNVTDIDAVNHLIDADGATYVMDRGYGEKTKIGGWLERNIPFIVRVKSNFRVDTLEVLSSESKNVSRYEIVSIKTRIDDIKLVEFTDHEGTFFRIITNRLDLNPEEILETYKNRWLIELFFKWIKQHIKLDHLFSLSPIGIWNQLYISLITFGLIELLRLKSQPNKSSWDFYRLMRLYLLNTWENLEREFNRKPKKRTRGRQVSGLPPNKAIRFGEDYAIVVPKNRNSN